MTAQPLSLGQCATLACLFEASAAKPGNVHRGADFEDLTYTDFVLSATAIGPVFEQAEQRRAGELIRAAIQATRRWVSTNTNLGTVLLLAPLAVVPRDVATAAGIQRALDQLDADDCRLVYEAIRLAQPGGLGNVPQGDVRDPAPGDLVAAMRLAADRDLVARQYTNAFHEVLHEVVPWLSEELRGQRPLQTAIIRTQLRLLAAHPDSLIARKCGLPTAEQASTYAQQILELNLVDEDEFESALGDFDFWLRSDGHRRNPGTTADLIAAGLFVLLRDGQLQLPVKFY